MGKAMKYPCGRIGCTADGTHYPVLSLTFKGYLGEPVKSMLGLPVCPPHQRMTAVDDLLSDEGWEQILKAFEAIGRVQPDRDETRLTWEPIDSPMAQEFRKTRRGTNGPIN